MKKQKRYYMDEDDFKSPNSEPEFEHLVPKSFVSAERKIKNRLVKALDKIESVARSASNQTNQEPSVLLNTYASVINQILNIIKDVDINDKRCED